MKTDATIAPPPQRQRFSLTNVSWLVDARKDAIEKTLSIYFLVCKDLTINDVGEGVEGHRIP